MSQARKQHAQSQEVTEQECAGKEQFLEAREVDRKVGSDWDQIVKGLYEPCSKVCLGFILKSIGSLQKPLLGRKVGTKIVFGFRITEMSKTWSLSRQV